MPTLHQRSKRPVLVPKPRTKMAQKERQLPFRLKSSPKTQSWAEWWDENITQGDGRASKFRISDTVPEQLADIGPINSSVAEARLLALARRSAWVRTERSDPSKHYHNLLGHHLNPLQLDQLARASVLDSLDHSIFAETGNMLGIRTATPKELEQPSLQLINEATDECADAIREYILRYPRNDIPWNEDLGLHMASTERFKPEGLLRDDHKAVMDFYLGRLPAGFAALDASRPWMYYWTINAITTMKLDFNDIDALVQSLVPIQNRSGGFGGGHGQYSHLATTYAATLALVCCGLPEDSLAFVDRVELYEWLGRLKQASGAFTMAEGGEVDNRAVYIVMVLVTLYNLPRELPSSSPARAHGHTLFSDGIGEFVRSCQTYEGGIGCNPWTEAHGAYTFCGLAALYLLDSEQGPFKLHEYLDVDSLLQWLLWRQEDITGGLAGRTNKVVDNCYSHWIGDCWPLLENALPGNPELFDRNALALYILTAGQDADGGLRDKPSKSADAYHSCYGLAGFSMTMWRWTFDKGNWSHDRYDPTLKEPPAAPLHPLYCVPVDCAEAALHYFQQRPLASSR